MLHRFPGNNELMERRIYLVGGPNSENMRFLENIEDMGRLERGRERERQMNLEIRSRNEDNEEINQQLLLDIRNNGLHSDLERNRFQVKNEKIWLWKKDKINKVKSPIELKYIYTDDLPSFSFNI